MIHINENYLKLKAGYLFPEINRRVKAFVAQNPEAKIIRLGIGDVTQPLPLSAIEALTKASQEMGHKDTFRGYGPEQGYDFLREAIAKNEYTERSIPVDASEIFISDGSKCDTGNIQEIFAQNIKVAVTDPVYPVYVDTNVMAGRTGSCNSFGQYENLIYLPTTAENNFFPPLPNEPADLIYICSPNNPTGTVLPKEQLTQWVDYAIKNKSLILFDAAYEAFITDPSLPHSIYEIEGAKKCAIEFRSFSKKAGFTGLRCAYTVVPKDLKAYTKDGTPVELHTLWNRRHCTKFNGVSYPVQRAAESIYSSKGKEEVKKLIDFYLTNAKLIKNTLKDLGYPVFGGEHAPYIWFKTSLLSWDFFDKLLTQYHIVGTPGSGFGPAGENYFRLSAFGDRNDIEQAIKRLKDGV